MVNYNSLKTEQCYTKIIGSVYIGYKEGRLWNINNGNEIKSNPVSVRFTDGHRYSFRRERLIYAAINKINPMHVSKYKVIDNKGNAVDRHNFYSQHKKYSVINKYPASISEYRRLLDCIEKNEPADFLFDHMDEVKSYCRHHLMLSEEESYELAMCTIVDFLERIISKSFPTSLVGYMQGSARRMLAARRKYQNYEKKIMYYE